MDTDGHRWRRWEARGGDACRVILVGVLGALAACSRAAVGPGDGSRTGPAAAAAVTVMPAKAPAAAATVSGPGRAGGPDGGVAPDGPRQVVTHVVGAGLDIEVTNTEEPRTMHLADRVVVRAGDRLVAWVSDVPGGRLAPLVERVVDLGNGRALLLGWSSQGGGMQSLHATILDVATLAVVDWLRADLRRGNAALVLEGTGRLGVTSADPGPDGGIETTGAWIPPEALGLLATAAANSERDVYAPPFGGNGAGSGPMAFFAIGTDGFGLESPCTDPRVAAARIFGPAAGTLDEREADLDGDGDQELAVSASGFSGSGGSLWQVFARDGDCLRWAGTLDGDFGTGAGGAIVVESRAGSCDVLERRAVLARGLMREREARDCGCAVEGESEQPCTAWVPAWVDDPSKACALALRPGDPRSLWVVPGLTDEVAILDAAGLVAAILPYEGVADEGTCGAVVEDYDGDGSLDVGVLWAEGAYQVQRRVWLWDPTAAEFWTDELLLGFEPHAGGQRDVVEFSERAAAYGPFFERTVRVEGRQVSLVSEREVE
ncbi:MAG: hypothetical protein HY905_02540 [Deltaproteobacteria bacterium]|nr:hypothetical protein [Deltaproteobacteria bacterium]